MTIVPDMHPSYQIQTGNTYVKHLFAEAIIVFFVWAIECFLLSNHLVKQKTHQRKKKGNAKIGSRTEKIISEHEKSSTKKTREKTDE